MKYILLFLSIIAIFTIAFILTPSLTSPTGFVIAKDNEEIPSFRTYTTAVCNNVSGFVVCHDELFASCGGIEYRLPNEEVNGQSIFGKDWEDPRDK